MDEWVDEWVDEWGWGQMNGNEVMKVTLARTRNTVAPHCTGPASNITLPMIEEVHLSDG